MEKSSDTSLVMVFGDVITDVTDSTS